MSSRSNERRAPGNPRRNPRKSSVVDDVANATIPAKKVGQWGCLDCSHRSNRADHLKEHMIFQHHRDKNDPFFKTLNHTRWETCPGCNQSKSKLNQHKKSCKEFLAKMAPQEGLNRTMASREGGSSECSSSPSNPNASPGSNEANKERTPPVGNESCAKYRCPDCAYTTQYGYHLRRHMMTLHKRSKHDAFFRTNGVGRRKSCPKCFKEVYDLVEHRKLCPAWPSKPRASLTRSIPRKVKALQPKVCLPVLKILKTSNLEDCFRQYLGVTAPSTRSNYERHFRTFCRFYSEQVPLTNPKDLFLTAKDPFGRASILDSCRVKKFLSQCNTSTALNAAKALTKFLGMYEEFLINLLHEIDHEVFQEARQQIKEVKQIIREMRSDVVATKRDQMLANLFTQGARPNQKALGRRPQEVRKYCLQFIQSQHVTQLCDRVVSSSGQNDLDKFAINPTFLRDLTMGLLELTTGGLRGVSIRSLTLKEYQRRKVVSEDPFEVTMKCHAHRVAPPDNISEVIVKSRIVMEVLSRYVEHSRLLIGNPAILAKPKSPLFPTIRNRIPCSTKIAIAWVRSVMLKKLRIKDDADPELTTLNSSAIRNAFTSNSAGRAEFKQKMAAGPISNC